MVPAVEFGTVVLVVIAAVAILFAGVLAWRHVIHPYLIRAALLARFRVDRGREMTVEPFVPKLGALSTSAKANSAPGVSGRHGGRSTIENFEMAAVKECLKDADLALGLRAFEVVVTSRAADVNHDVLLRHSHAFGKAEVLKAILDPVTGQRCSILMDGDDHAVRRRLLSPAFSSKNLRKLIPLFLSAAAHHVDSLAKAVVEAGGVDEVDVVPVLSRATLSVVGTAALGGFEAACGSSTREPASLRVAEALCGLAEKVDKDTAANPWHLLLPRGWFRAIPTPSNLETLRRYNEVCKITDAIIVARKEHLSRLAPGEPRPQDILQIMLDADDDDSSTDARRSRKMTMSDIRDESMFLIFAGHDTTTSALTWALFLLTQYPEWAERARLEADKARASKAGPFEDGSAASASRDLARSMPVLNGVFMEAIRLFPPVALYSRMALEDIRVGDGGRLFLPRGACVAIPAGVIHRDERAWPDAEAFDPGRFMSDEQVESLGLRRLTADEAHAWAARREHGTDAPSAEEESSVAHPRHEGKPGDMSFIPFAAGASMCLGFQFARMEAVSLLSHLVARFDVELPGDYVHEPVNYAVTRPRDGMRLRLRLRDLATKR